jgi:hypothetical protein
MTFSMFCAELPTPVTFDSLGAAINAACKFAKRGCHDGQRFEVLLSRPNRT